MKITRCLQFDLFPKIAGGFYLLNVKMSSGFPVQAAGGMASIATAFDEKLEEKFILAPDQGKGKRKDRVKRKGLDTLFSDDMPDTYFPPNYVYTKDGDPATDDPVVTWLNTHPDGTALVYKQAFRNRVFMLNKEFCLNCPPNYFSGGSLQVAMQPKLQKLSTDAAEDPGRATGVRVFVIGYCNETSLELILLSPLKLVSGSHFDSEDPETLLMGLRKGAYILTEDAAGATAAKNFVRPLVVTFFEHLTSEETVAISSEGSITVTITEQEAIEYNTLRG